MFRLLVVGNCSSLSSVFSPFFCLTFIPPSIPQFFYSVQFGFNIHYESLRFYSFSITSLEFTTITFSLCVTLESIGTAKLWYLLCYHLFGLCLFQQIVNVPKYCLFNWSELHIYCYSSAELYFLWIYDVFENILSGTKWTTFLKRVLNLYFFRTEVLWNII